MIFSIENIAAKLQDRLSNQKYYFVDNGLLNLFLFDGSKSLLENIVAIFLREKYGDDVFYYNDNVEVDFCLLEHCQAIQVAFSVQDARTCERETRALVAYNRRFPDSRLMILTMDEERDIEVDGCHIEIRPVWKWMLCSDDRVNR